MRRKALPENAYVSCVLCREGMEDVDHLLWMPVCERCVELIKRSNGLCLGDE